MKDGYDVSPFSSYEDPFHGYKVGDRVRILAFDIQPQTIGEVVTIKAIFPLANWPVIVDFDGNKYPTSSLYFEEIERSG